MKEIVLHLQDANLGEIDRIEWGELDAPPACLRNSYWGWTIDAPEWSMTLRLTGRQDGQTSWLLALTEIDGRVSHETGLTTSSWPTSVAVANAIRAMTEKWLYPIQVEITTK